jgi:hypothetical protein
MTGKQRLDTSTPNGIPVTYVAVILLPSSALLFTSNLGHSLIAPPVNLKSAYNPAVRPHTCGNASEEQSFDEHSILPPSCYEERKQNHGWFQITLLEGCCCGHGKDAYQRARILQKSATFDLGSARRMGESEIVYREGVRFV